MIKKILLIALGGGIGSVIRYIAAFFVEKHLSCAFPLGTFVINITGCLLIGVLLGLSERYNFFNNELKFLLIIGLCGGYTTFSAFSTENLQLFESGRYLILTLYAAGSVFVGFSAVWFGNYLSKIFF